MEASWLGGNGGGGGSAPVPRALNPFLPLVGPACRSSAGRSVYHAPAAAAGLKLPPCHYPLSLSHHMLTQYTRHTNEFGHIQ